MIGRLNGVANLNYAVGHFEAASLGTLIDQNVSAIGSVKEHM